MPNWFITLVVVLIVGIVLDGLRRVRLHRRENIRISRRAKIADRELAAIAEKEQDQVASEFPSGGARLVGRRDVGTIDSQSKNPAKSQLKKQTPVVVKELEDADRVPEQASLNLDEIVPMLMDPVAEFSNKSDAPFSEKISPDNAGYAKSKSALDAGEVKSQARESLDILAEDPSYDNNDGSHRVDEGMVDHRDAAEHNASLEPISNDEPSLGSLSDIDNALESTELIEEAAPSKYKSGLFGKKPQLDGESKRQKKKREAKQKQLDEEASLRAHNELPESDEERQEIVQEVVVVNIMAKSNEQFGGEMLLNALMQSHLKFGEMDIFHRFEDENGSGEKLFSLANMIMPGTFNLAEMKSFNTPGVTLFMALPVAIESLDAFNMMITSAKNIASFLGGELKDENRSVMTAQTIEHAKQKVIEFERKRKIHAR